MTDVRTYVGHLELVAEQLAKQASDLINHPGEKGRASEQIARGIIRAILPKKFSIGTGFIVSSRGHRSRQQDLVLFDETMNAPILLAGDVGIFPVECVYGTVEIKSTLNGKTIREAAESIAEVRGFGRRRYYKTRALLETKRGRKTTLAMHEIQWINKFAPRSYLFAFNTRHTIEWLENEVRKVSAETGAFFHGVIVLKKHFVCQVKPEIDGLPPAIRCETQNVLVEFARKMTKDIMLDPMMAADMSEYWKDTRDKP